MRRWKRGFGKGEACDRKHKARTHEKNDCGMPAIGKD
jgi:hypothetical protein